MEIKEFATHLVKEGYRRYASDLYILPEYQHYHLYLRYHRQRQRIAQLSLAVGEQLILFFKFLGDMDVGEKRFPQAGSCQMMIDGNPIHIRLSTVSNYRHQESLVIRFLYPLKKESLYFLYRQKWEETLKVTQSPGLHLFCGPVGSGKTTSMYMIAKEHSHNQQIISIEDPVEIEEDDFLQLQVQSKIQLDYDELIKLCLRHRPDVMIIGEIRDDKTARYAMRAALTGHCVLATVHAKSFTGVIARLKDLGLSQIDIEQGLQTITYQRIIPIYCPFCKGECSPFCMHYREHYPALLVSQSQEEGRKVWNEALQKAWHTGFISKDILSSYYLD